MSKNQIDHSMEQSEAAVEEYLKSIGLDFSAFENGDEITKIFILKMTRLELERKARMRKIDELEKSAERSLLVVIAVSIIGLILSLTF